MSGNRTLNGEACKVIGRPAPDEARVRLECYKPELEQFEDSKTGTVSVDKENLVAI
jgi:hypothetical protein